MKLKTQPLIAIFFGMLFSLLADTLLFADTRSASVRVSCTILPIIEISSARILAEPVRKELEIRSNKNYHLTESIRKAGSDKIKLYSVTAL